MKVGACRWHAPISYAAYADAQVHVRRTSIAADLN